MCTAYQRGNDGIAVGISNGRANVPQSLVGGCSRLIIGGRLCTTPRKKPPLIDGVV